MIHNISTLIDKIEHMEPVTLSGVSIPYALHSTLTPAQPYSRETLERALAVKLPDELCTLWTRVSGLRLFEDVRYGQWGLILWSPEHLVDAHRRRIKGREQDFRAGDVILGEFLGDSDLLVLRCDPAACDYGNVMIALPIDPRDEWYTVGASLLDFLIRFVDANGEKFWERP